MSLELWGAIVLIFGLLAWAYLTGQARFRDIERRAAMYRHPASGDDHSLTVFERLPLYDHEARGDFE